MKKIILVMFFCLFIFCGCEVMNTPTKKVESMLNNYQNKSDKVMSDLEMVMNSETLFSKEQKDIYKNILLKQYSNLKYRIVKETIDGNKSNVECEIEVYNLAKSIKEAEDYLNSNLDKFKDSEGNIKNSEYNNYKLELLKNNSDRITYTIYFSLNKVNDKWVLDDLTESERLKLHGLYTN